MRTLTRAMAGLALVSMTAIADDAGRGAFENEIRILPAFLAELTHSTTGTGRQADTAIVAVHPGSGQVWMYYASLGIEILAQRGGIRTVSEAENLPQRWRTERVAKAAAALYLLTKSRYTETMRTEMQVRTDHVAYRLWTGSQDRRPIVWIEYRFDSDGLLAVEIEEDDGSAHRLTMAERRVLDVSTAARTGRRAPEHPGERRI